MNEPNTMWIKVFTDDGTPISLTLAIDTVASVNTRLQEIQQAGLLLKEPAGNVDTEEIRVVVRRKSKGGHTVIDLYPEWRVGNKGKFGEFKFAHVYLGNADETAEFEAQSGLKVSELPVYPGPGALSREYEQPTEFERPVRRFFKMNRTIIGQDENGRNQYKYEYTSPVHGTQTPPADGNGNGSKNGNTESPWYSDPEKIMQVVNIAIEAGYLAQGMTPADALKIIGKWENYPTGKEALAAIKNSTQTIPF